MDEESWTNKEIQSRKTRRMIMNSIEEFYTEEIAQNPKTSPDILRKILEIGNYDLISCYAAGNPYCPPETLKMILERGNDDPVSWHSAENPNCPSEALKMVLDRGKDDVVSWNAARNPNCPHEAKIKWMRKIGGIKRFDPEKHEE